MKIRTLWEHGLDTESPWLVVAVDEYTEDEHGGTPEFYQKELETNPAIRRELIIEIADRSVDKLFETPMTVAYDAYSPEEKK